MALAPSRTERLARDRVFQAVTDRLKKKEDYSRDITIAMKSGWDKRVDARRVLHALVHTRSCLGLYKNSTETPHCRLFLLPVEIILMITRVVTEPVDLFRLCMTCKYVVRTVLDAIATNSEKKPETELLRAAGCTTRDECTRFVHELDSALCLANYARQHRVHRFGVRPELGACLSALEAAHTSGGSAAKISLKTETVHPFPEAPIAASPSKNVFVVVDEIRSLLCVVVDFGDATAQCIAISSFSMRDTQINVLWSAESKMLLASFRVKNKFTVVSVDKRKRGAK